MDDITLTTPGLLFPAISLLLLAYTNRFLALSSLVRHLCEKYNENRSEPKFTQQVANLNLRLTLIRVMQSFGIASIFCCLLSMLCFLLENEWLAKQIFTSSVVLLMLSVVVSFTEIQISTNALRIELGRKDRFKKI